MRLTSLILLLALLPAPARAADATKMIYYASFAPRGVRSDLHVLSKVHGKCWTGSIASPRADASRCMVVNSVYDPCFDRSAGLGWDTSIIVCPVDPFSKRVVLIVLDKPIPLEYGNHGKPLPWALLISNGARCYSVTGATGVVAGMRISYACNTKGSVLGDVDRSTQLWRVFYSPNPYGSHYKRITVQEGIL